MHLLESSIIVFVEHLAVEGALGWIQAIQALRDFLYLKWRLISHRLPYTEGAHLVILSVKPLNGMVWDACF